MLPVLLIAAILPGRYCQDWQTASSIPPPSLAGDTLVNSLEDLGTLFSLLTNSKAKTNRRLELVENLDAVKNLVDNIAAPTENLVASLAEVEELVARIAGPVKQLLDGLPQPLKDLMDESASREEGLAEESASMEGLLEEIFT